MFGSVDSYGDVIVSKLDSNGKGTFFISLKSYLLLC